MADKGLASAALKYFGSINQAMHAAGVEPRPRGWTKQGADRVHPGSALRGLTLRDGVEGQVHVLDQGQRKGIQNQRVTMVEGPPEEVAVVQRIFHEFVDLEYSEYRIAECHGMYRPSLLRMNDDTPRAGTYARHFGSLDSALQRLFTNERDRARQTVHE